MLSFNASATHPGQPMAAPLRLVVDNTEAMLINELMVLADIWFQSAGALSVPAVEESTEDMFGELSQHSEDP